MNAAARCGEELRARIAPNYKRSGCKKYRLARKRAAVFDSDGTKTSRKSITNGLSVYYVPHVLGNCSAAALSPLTVADYLEFSHIEHIGSRNRSLMTRAALRRALSEVTQGALAPSQWVFTRDCFGKPGLDPSCPQVHFSCSHAEGVSVVAVSTRGPVGIDIANATTAFDLSLTDLFLSPAETRSLGDYSDNSPMKRQAFCRFWALKEAYLKMNGYALSERVREFEFDPVKDQLSLKPAGEKGPGQANFRTWQLAAERRKFSAAIAFLET
ncbi:MAG: 4'-phosphopantetheinyl transferase superfamily protein [Hyphomicrobiaceae bacterium]